MSKQDEDDREHWDRLDPAVRQLDSPRKLVDFNKILDEELGKGMPVEFLIWLEKERPDEYENLTVHFRADINEHFAELASRAVDVCMKRVEIWRSIVEHLREEYLSCQERII